MAAKTLTLPEAAELTGCDLREATKLNVRPHRPRARKNAAAAPVPSEAPDMLAGLGA